MIDLTIDMIPYGRENAVTREQLCVLTGMTDRIMRKALHELRRDYCIINLQNGRGYFRPVETDGPLVKRFLKQERARALSSLWASRGAKEWLKENT